MEYNWRSNNRNMWLFSRRIGAAFSAMLETLFGWRKASKWYRRKKIRTPLPFSFVFVPNFHMFGYLVLLIFGVIVAESACYDSQ